MFTTATATEVKTLRLVKITAVVISITGKLPILINFNSSLIFPESNIGVLI